MDAPPAATRAAPPAARPRQARHILFPAPGKMGKGVLVQTTLWGNLILGPTAADVADPATATRTPADIMRVRGARARPPPRRW